jgi:hypothetical protein
MYNDVWLAMGFMRYPLAFCFFAVLALALWSALKVFKPGASPEPTIKAWIDAILFWGGFAVICGVLGTLIGIILASQSIEAAGEVSPVLVWGGIKWAFLTSVFGILILAFAALSWFGLQLRWRLLTADRTNPTG